MLVDKPDILVRGKTYAKQGEDTNDKGNEAERDFVFILTIFLFHLVAVVGYAPTFQVFQACTFTRLV